MTATHGGEDAKGGQRRAGAGSPCYADSAAWVFARLSRNRQSTDLNKPPRLGNLQRMPIKLENVGIAVRDLEATIVFFTDLGLTVLGRDTVSTEWTATAVGLDGNHANIAMLPLARGRGELVLACRVRGSLSTQTLQP